MLGSRRPRTAERTILVATGPPNRSERTCRRKLLRGFGSLKLANRGNIPSGKPSRVQQSTRKENMSEASRQPKDKNYNLISVLYQASDNVEELKTYVQDAEQQGDQEIVNFFNEILENNLRASQRAKEMLVPRLQQEQE